MNRVLSRALTLFFPRRCRLCGEVVAFDESFCEECRAMHRLQGKICDKCGREQPDCVCKKEHFHAAYKAVCAPYYFSGSARRGIYRLKSSGFKELAPGMAEKMAACVRERFPEIAFDCVTFIPMTKTAEKTRGFNQSALLAEAVAKELCLPQEALLLKTVDTKSQRTSSARERKANLYGAFDIAPGVKVRGKTVLLVDDVKTTGATLDECTQVLRAGGAAAVYACAFTVTKANTKK